jgi:hypothetical protein
MSTLLSVFTFVQSSKLRNYPPRIINGLTARICHYASGPSEVSPLDFESYSDVVVVRTWQLLWVHNLRDQLSSRALTKLG